MAESAWSQQEIDTSVDAYLRMLAQEIAGERYNKAAVNRELREEELSLRSRGSVEMRMCNISTVLNDQGKRFIDGYKPRSNVGANVYPMIEAALLRHQILPEPNSRDNNRITLPDHIPTSHIQSALDRIDRDGFSPHSESTTYDLVIGEKTYPPIAVIAFALEDLSGEIVEPGTIRGGEGTQAFRILAEAGMAPVPKQLLSTSDLDQINSLLNSYSEIRDARRPGDSRRAGTFRAGWNDATERNKGEYTQSALSKVTWQNLGYRLGNELGTRSDEWIKVAYEHIAEMWDGDYFAPTSDEVLLDQKSDEYEDLVDEASDSYEGEDEPPPKSERPTYSYKRSARVKGSVRRIAKGTCELCEMPAPFKKTNGKPYLEVHHVVPLEDGGLDKTTNAVAVCPNCHMRCHHSADASDAAQELYGKVNRLVRQ